MQTSVSFTCVHVHIWLCHVIVLGCVIVLVGMLPTRHSPQEGPASNTRKKEIHSKQWERKGRERCVYVCAHMYVCIYVYVARAHMRMCVCVAAEKISNLDVRFV